jgi:S1-C subfamily serine protease
MMLPMPQLYKLSRSCLVFVVILLLHTPSAFAAIRLQQRMIEIFNETEPAIVRVKAAFRDTSRTDEERGHVTLRVGTGFFYNNEGHVIVNASRAYGADRVWIEYRGRAYAAEPLGHDRLTNISVLRVLEPPDSFGFIPLDPGLPEPVIGSLVFTVAHSLDFDASLGFGLLTGIENRLGVQIFPTRYLRSTISVEVGEGGCPLLDVNGRLIGVTVASIPEIGSSYALPTNALIRVRDDIVNHGEMIHSWMGFEVGERDGSEALHPVFLSKVLADTPAAKSDLREGDILLSIDGRMIHSVADVPGAVFFTRANQNATIRIQREDNVLDFSIKTLPRPQRDPLLIPRDGNMDVPVGVTPDDMKLLAE